jgi:Tol biopolymer transport system component
VLEQKCNYILIKAILISLLTLLVMNSCTPKPIIASPTFANTPSLTPVPTIVTPTETPTTVAPSPTATPFPKLEGKLIYCCGDDFSLRLLDFKTDRVSSIFSKGFIFEVLAAEKGGVVLPKVVNGKLYFLLSREDLKTYNFYQSDLDGQSASLILTSPDFTYPFIVSKNANYLAYVTNYVLTNTPPYIWSSELSVINLKKGGLVFHIFKAKSIEFFDFSNQGDRLAFLVDADEGNTATLYIVNPNGSDLTKVDISPAPTIDQISWSPDGSQLALILNSDDSNQPGTFLYTLDVKTLGLKKLTDLEWATHPFWSPSGDKIAFWQGSEIWVISPDGSDLKLVKPERGDDANIYQMAWSPDGQYIVYRWENEENKITFFVVSVNGGEPKDIGPTEDVGRWLIDPVWISNDV